ncbi:thrombospondin type 3 repeat-containing protein [Pendulispora brunnea]|uniref:Thrombospondin type 3 repeat-containing protein n=1 Tax=Pendulispora brunnea TaxID=2905690 RepID=A0ABZ2KKX3_9BACT
MKPWSLRLASFVVVVSAALPASATPNFPSAIQRDLQLNAPPQCTLCHNNPAGGTGTVTQPFGMKMRSRGLVPEDEGSLQTALTALQAEGSDVDNDGVPDIQELRLGTDPNGAGEETPSYGCGSSISPVSPRRALPDASVILSGTLMAIGAIFLRRRRNARTERAENEG